MSSIQKFNSKYDIPKLIEVLPELMPKIISNKKGEATIDFSDSESILLLNKALLKFHYQINDWHLPDGYLIPPIPGRADYVSGIVDLIISECSFNPDTRLMEGIDMGCGASCIYPILFTAEYGGKMLAVDNNEKAIKNARKIIKANKKLEDRIEVVQQSNSKNLLHKVIPKDRRFEFLMCNPPFYESEKAAAEANIRKEKNLKTGKRFRNFKGQKNELIFPGGEKLFISQLIKESFEYKKSVLWYSSLVSKKENLKLFSKLLKHESIQDIKVVEMNRGNKTGRFISWSFFTKKQRTNWLNYRLK
jgi:23S rRNA (adenine1618-N6)-methyltransferase